MKPELLLSVDSERRFWLDPRTKLYMLVIFSIVMIDGKTDGISFWLKPILALVPFFLLLSGSRKKVAIIYLIVFVVSWMVNIFLVPYMGLIGTIIISLLAQFGTRWFPSAMMGYYLLSTRLVSLSLPCSVCIYQKHSLSRFLLCSGSSLQFPKKRDLLETLCV